MKGIFDKLAAVIIATLLVSFIFPLLPAIPENNPKKFASYEELKSFVSPVSYGSFGESFATTAMRSESQVAAESQTKEYSPTNIQVAGVDEADIVKSDGKYLYVVSGNKVIIADAYPAESARILSEIKLDGTPTEIFINKDKLVVFGSENSYISKPTIPSPEIARSEIYPRYPNTFIKVYVVSDRENPVLARNISLSGNYFDSRMINDYVYVITNQPVYGEPIPLPIVSSSGKITTTPASEIYYFDYPDRSYAFTNILAINTQNDEEPLSKTFLMGSTQNIYVSLNNIYVVYTKRLSEFHIMDRLIDDVIVPIVPADVQNKIKAAKSETSTYKRLQIAAEILRDYTEQLNPTEQANFMKTVQEKMLQMQMEIAKETEKTIIHKISINGGKVEYQTNSEVPGHVLNQFSMDEHDGYFRIATTTNPRSGFASPRFATQLQTASIPIAGSFVSTVAARTTPTDVLVTPMRATTSNNVYILDGDLRIVGKLENLAPGERIYSVRFIGDKGYMVTFRQIDPLFVISLNPANPEVLGYLKIPGVSDYLHPYDENHLIGIGRDATEEGRIQGLKLSLFDVTDVSNPKEISKFIIGESGASSEALRDHKAFLFSKTKGLLVIPVNLVEKNYRQWQGAFVFGIDLNNGFDIKGRVSHSNGGYDYQAQIRRSLYIDDVLYTVSGKMIKMNSLESLEEINNIELPDGQIIYPVRGI